MPDSRKRLLFNNHLWAIYLLSIVLLVIVWYFQWVLGLIMTVLILISLYYTVMSEKTFLKKQEKYISTLSYRVKKLGKEALLEMPIGIILYEENGKIEWSNP